MSIRALHYITGDTPQSGFRRIGGSEDFPADDLPLLNNGAVIQERARREARNTRQSAGNGFRQVSHVWEYQTGKYGCPVIINTIGAIGVGRPHAFSEYIVGLTDNVAEIGDPGSIIRGAESFQMLNLERFSMIPGQEEIPCPDEIWEAIAESPNDKEQPEQVDQIWLRTLLCHYWKQASVRAFSKDAPMTVRVNLGQFDAENTMADIEETIRKGKRFFSKVITPKLPKQVQNIASMAAGVNCGDVGELYSALEFDIMLNMYEDETLQLRRPRELHRYRLNDGEMQFISLVCEGKIPAVVKDVFDRYQTLTGFEKTDATQVPFMADYRVWYHLYCLDQMTKDSTFAVKAGLTVEEDNPERIRPARACFLLLRRLRNILGNEHRLNENRKNFATELLAPLESTVLKAMLTDMEQENASPFLLRRNEMVEYHRHTLYSALDDQVENLIRLAVKDQQRAKAPQFVRCYPATPLRSQQADERNGRLLRALLPAVIRPLIETEVQRGTIENKYLDQLRTEEFADRWACLESNEKTHGAMTEFLLGEIEDHRKHFLLYKISLKYFPGKDLFLTTMRHFSAQHIRPDQRPEERRLKIAAYGAREYISADNRSDPECLKALNQYYFKCFEEYRDHIEDISDVIRILGGDTTDALKMVFEKGIKGKWLTPEEAKAAIRAFGGDELRFARKSIILDTYSDMLSRRRREAVVTKDAKAFNWLCEMTENSPWRNRQDWVEEQHTENIRMLCEISEKTGEPIAATSMSRIREWVQEGSVQLPGVQRLQQYCENELQRGNQTTVDMLIPCFTRIDESCPKLRKILFDRANKQFADGLTHSNGTLGNLISECIPDVIKAGRNPDDLYTENQDQVEEYLQRYFAENTDLNRLISEQETIPDNTAFARSWREKVNDQFYNQQTELFNRQPNYDRLMELREEIVRRGSRMNESLRAAYELLDGYGNMFETLAQKSEYDALADTARMLRQINDLLTRAGDTRKKLCVTMRDMTWPEEKSAQTKSFRHRLCSEMLRGVLTDSERTGVGRERSGQGCPDWHKVLNNLFSDKAELDDAIHKPYTEQNLCVLQQLLATVNTVNMMTAYGLDNSWEEDLILAIHQESDLKRYQSALARNRKMSDYYQLQFDGDGLVFSRNNAEYSKNHITNR